MSEPAPASTSEGARLNERWAVAGLTVASIGAAIAWMGGLDFPFFRDEVDYWRQSLLFVRNWPPSLEFLSSYGEPMTPLSFLVWAQSERIFGGGIAGMRLLNVFVAAATMGLIGWRVRTPERRGLLACCGLVLFPYWVPLSILIYTDMMSAFCVVLGAFFYARGRAIWSAVAFVLAIATRQYAVTFPAAIIAAELTPVLLRQRAPRWEVIGPMGAACASLLGWVALFGGLGPDPGLDTYPTHSAALTDLNMSYGLYFLSCIGIYFVVPELLFFGRWQSPRKLSNTTIGLCAAACYFAFALFPPQEPITMGPLNRIGLMLFPPDVIGSTGSLMLRTFSYATLAWIACLRFARLDLISWLILSRFVLMTISWEGWEKYNTPLIAVMWYFRSVSSLAGPTDLWRIDAPAPSAVDASDERALT